MRLRRESAGCCDVGQAEIRLREKLARAQYAPFEHITVCGHPGCGAKQAREVSAAVAAFPASILRLRSPSRLASINSFTRLSFLAEAPMERTTG